MNKSPLTSTDPLKTHSSPWATDPATRTLRPQEGAGGHAAPHPPIEGPHPSSLAAVRGRSMSVTITAPESSLEGFSRTPIISSWLYEAAAPLSRPLSWFLGHPERSGFKTGAHSPWILEAVCGQLSLSQRFHIEISVYACQMPRARPLRWVP